LAFNNVRQHKLALVVTGFLANSDTTVAFQLVLPLFDDLIDVTKVFKACWKKRCTNIKFNNFISSISFGDVILMSVSFDSTCRELKRDITMLNFTVSTYLLE